MTHTRSTTLRPMRALFVLLTAAAVAVGSAPAQAASKTSTQVRGWSTTTQNATAGSTVRFVVKVTSGGRASAKRTVVLQRYAGGRWINATQVRSSKYGNAVLRLSAGSAGTTHRVRVHVKATGTRKGAVTKVKRVAVSAPATTSATANEILALVNRARSTSRTCGSSTYRAVKPLTLDSRLNAAAQGHATDMAAADYFSHTGRDDSSVADRVTRQGYAWSAVGENIAAGQRTAAEVMDGWLASPGHCRNIMNGTYTELGVGKATNTASTYQVYWVQNFATPR